MSTRAADADRLLGREHELSVLGGFLERIAEGPSVMVVEGRAGIGKTTLWAWVVADARDRGHAVMSCGASESEARLSYSSLADLLEGVLDDVLPGLPEPQRTSLAVALLREEATGGSVDRHAVSAGVLGTLRRVAAAAPLLVAVDDVQWLDAPSAAALAFALRRLTNEPVGVLFALRTAGAASVPLGLGQAFAPERIRRLAVAPLRPKHVARLVGARFPGALARPALTRVVDGADGNPFVAVELARARTATSPSASPGAPLPVPEDARALARLRLRRFPAAGRTALLAVAALSRPSRAVVERAMASFDGHGPLLGPALDDGLIEADGDRLRFAHPLFRSAVYAAAGPAERRTVHRRLAAAVVDPEERARHRALGSEEPDAGVAEDLDAAARSALRRGAPDAAAELSALAEGLTPATDAVAGGERAVRTARCAVQAGDLHGAVAALDRALLRLPAGHARANALILRAYQELEIGDATAAGRSFAAARLEADGDADLLCDVEQGLAMLGADLRTGVRHARAAVALAERGRDPVMHSEALATLAWFESRRGTGIRLDLLDRADAVRVVDNSGEHARTISAPRWMRGSLLLWKGDLDGARAVLEAELVEANDRGDQDELFYVLLPLAHVELRAGNMDRAAEHAMTCWDVAAWAGSDRRTALGLLTRASVDAVIGAVDRVEALLEQAAAVSEGWQTLEALTSGVRGFVRLSSGDADGASRLLLAAVEAHRAIGLEEPAFAGYLPDAVEALILAGDLDGADRLLRPYERRSRRLARTVALGSAARCRGMLHAARGEAGAAARSLDRALARHEASRQPMEIARTLLARGVVERRSKRKAAARASLERAASIFETLGSGLWLERTRAELRRIGGRQPAPLDLTDTERRVADLAAAGRTNREIAAALFLSVHTVEANLSRAYRKLSVRSRTELARALDGS